MTEEDAGRIGLVGGRYELEEMIGSGAMSKVWRARDERLDRVVAIKFLAEHLSDDPKFRERFDREIRTIASLSHPSIVSVHDAGVDDAPYFVMELVDGRTLRDVLSSEGTLSIDKTTGVAMALLDALEHAHEHGVIHRDVKPENVVVSPDGVVKLTDFGISKSHAFESGLTMQGTLVGTARYAAPEQLSGTPVGPSTDLYALGTVLYECLSGTPPFVEDDFEKTVSRQRFADPVPIADHRPAVPSSLSNTVMRSLAKSPKDRFDTARAMRTALLAGTSPNRDGAAPTDEASDAKARDLPRHGSVISKRVGEFVRTHPVMAGVLGACVVIAAVLVVAVLATSSGPDIVLRGGSLTAGSTLGPGQSLASTNGAFVLTMKPTGVLQTAATAGTVPNWEDAAAGLPGSSVIMQGDGNLVVYPKGTSAPAPGQPTPATWFSGTDGHPGAKVVMEGNGNLVVLAPSGATLWQTDDIPGSEGPTLRAGEKLLPGEYLSSPNGQYRLLESPTTGNLQLTPSSEPTCVWWESDVSTHTMADTVFSGFGTLTILGLQSQRVLWTSKSGFAPGASLSLNDSGVLSILSATGTILWSTGIKAGTRHQPALHPTC